MNRPDGGPPPLEGPPESGPISRQVSGRTQRRRPLTFDAFHTHHHKLWLRYAHTQVGSKPAAETVVETACARLLEHWEHVLTRQSVPEYAWRVLKEEVTIWLERNGRPPVLVGTAAFHSAIRKLLLNEMRDEFAVLEGEIGLYSAIARLPERQYDVIVLRYVLGCPDEEVAEYLGIEPATVRSHVRHAKRRLAKDLGTAGPGEG